MNLSTLPLPQLRELAHEAIARIGEAKRQLAALNRDSRGLDLTQILANVGSIQAWLLEQGILSDQPPDAGEMALGEKVVEQAGRMAELAEKSSSKDGALTTDERAELKAVVAFIAEPAERMLIRKRIAEDLLELAGALNSLIAQGERVQGAHETIEALAKRMRS